MLKLGKAGAPAPSPLQAFSRRQPGCRLHLSRAFRSDDSSAPSRAAERLPLAKPGPAPGSKASLTISQRSPLSPDVQPLWRKASFPFLVLIVFVTLPFDILYGQLWARHITQNDAATGPSSHAGSSSSRLSRHAKAIKAPVKPPTTAPASNMQAAKQEAAAAAFGQEGHHQPQQTARKPSTSPARLAAQAAKAANQASSAAATAEAAAARSSNATDAASKRRAETVPGKAETATGAAGPSSSGLSASWGAPGAAIAAAADQLRPVDSWDANGYGSLSDEEAEQQAKAMVIELITHPKDTEAALLRATGAAGPAGEASGRPPSSVSPDYIDALVQAVREPSVGMPQHPAVSEGADDAGSSSSSSTSGAETTADPGAVQSTPPSNASKALEEPAIPGLSGTQEVAGVQQQDVRQLREGQRLNPSPWSWLEGSPRSSQDEF